jgi:hypothetical protein
MLSARCSGSVAKQAEIQQRTANRFALDKTNSDEVETLTILSVEVVCDVFIVQRGTVAFNRP